MAETNPQPAPRRTRAAETLRPGALHFSTPTDNTLSANPADTMTVPAVPAPSFKRRLAKYVCVTLGLFLGMYLVFAYVIIPYAWANFMARHPALETAPRTTTNLQGVPADPINVALIGSKQDVITILGHAGWQPADDITLKSCLKITHATLFKKQYATAPISPLKVFGRTQDLAFQHPAANPHQRHHVRFWESEDEDDEGRPLWIGAATFDDRVGLTYTTLQVTHHIDANIDAERDKLFKDLAATGYLAESALLDDFHDHREGRNGGGHAYRTDGRLALGLVLLVSPGKE